MALYQHWNLTTKRETHDENIAFPGTPGRFRVQVMPPMSEHQRETAFLRHCISYDESPERSKLDERVIQLQRNERCMRRAVWSMAVSAALAMAGLGYSSVFLDEFPHRMSQFVSHFAVKGFFALGVGSLVSLLAFAGLWAAFRRELDQRREECRQLITKLIVSRLSKPVGKPLRDVRYNGDGAGNGRAVRVLHQANGFAVSSTLI